MKIRETINSNAEKYSATVYEHQNKVVVVKRDTFNYYDNSTNERFCFDTVSAYREWLSRQDWIVPGKIRSVSPFKAVTA